MHIVKFAFESVGFDIRLMRGGLASLVWNLAREFADQGHRVSVITPAHGCLEHLRAHYELEELDHVDRHTVPLVLDRAVWPGHPAELELRLTTRAHRLRHEGVDIYFLSDEYLDLLPERIYPARTSEGHDLAFFKPLVFQVSGLRFLRAHLDLGAEPAVVQAYEPYYHYLLPPVLRTDPRFLVVSTLASNMPINQQVHRPQLERLLELFDTDADLDALADPPATGRLAAAMTSQLPSTHLADRPTADGIGYYALVAANCDLLDFLTPGQLDFYST
ncbi:glycogen/starch synthase, partial [Kitasatospora sp. NPDC058263]